MADAADLIKELMEAHAEERRLWNVSNEHTARWSTALQRVNRLKKEATMRMLEADLIDLDHPNFTRNGVAAPPPADDIPF